MSGFHIPNYIYGDEATLRRLHEVWRSPETAALTDYVWDHGGMKHTFTGPDPGREDWAKWAHHYLVYYPLLTACQRTQIERYVDGAKCAPWEVDPDKIKRVIDDTVDYYCRHRETILAFCPLSFLSLSSMNRAEIADDIKIEGWEPRERFIFLSRHLNEHASHELTSPLAFGVMAIIRIEGHAEQREQENIPSLVASRLDLLKWALFVALVPQKPVAEGVCILEGRMQEWRGTLRRDTNVGASTPLSQTSTDRCAELVRQFRQAAVQFPDLAQSLWHFGRTCIPVLPRDILLESAIGLDSVLVPDPGESGYRFRLHGTVVLSKVRHDPALEIYDMLRRIYGERSRAAHGNRPAKEVEGNALAARKALADVILAISNLIVNGELPPGRVAEGVERYVLQQATSLPPNLGNSSLSTS